MQNTIQDTVFVDIRCIMILQYNIAGNPSGLLGLGIMHLTGQGAEVDYTLAAKYFKRSMEMSQDWTGIGDAYFYSGTSLRRHKCVFAARENIVTRTHAVKNSNLHILLGIRARLSKPLCPSG